MCNDCTPTIEQLKEIDERLKEGMDLIKKKEERIKNILLKVVKSNIDSETKVELITMVFQSTIQPVSISAMATPIKY